MACVVLHWTCACTRYDDDDKRDMTLGRVREYVFMCFALLITERHAQDSHSKRKTRWFDYITVYRVAARESRSRVQRMIAVG